MNVQGEVRHLASQHIDSERAEVVLSPLVDPEQKLTETSIHPDPVPAGRRSTLSSMRFVTAATRSDYEEWVRASTVTRFDNYNALVERVREVFGDDLKASNWLSKPNKNLGGRTPLEEARAQDYNVRALEPMLIAIEHGIYS